MAKFKFRLQSYFNLKEKLEEQKKLDYGKAMSELERERQKKIQLEKEREDCIIAFRDNINLRIDPESFKSYNLYLEAVKKRIVAQEEAIRKAEQVVEIKRAELVEAMKERKMLETLREKQYVEYIDEEKKLEQKAVDEIVSYRYNKR